MDFKQLFQEAINSNELNKIDEYVSGGLQDKIYSILKTHGFDCDSSTEEISDFLSDTSKTLKYRDIQQLAKDFSKGTNCKRHMLQKIFSPKRKKAYKSSEKISYVDGDGDF